MADHKATVEAFRQAASGNDPEALAALLAPDVRFFSPAVHQPYEGHEAVMTVLGAALRVLHPLQYSDVVVSDDRAVLFFTTEVGGKRVEGIDALRFDAEARIRELVVMIRPLSALNTVVKGMAEALGVATPG